MENSRQEVMVSKPVTIPGVVKNGVIIPRADHPLPEGMRVDILISSMEIPPELRAEFEAWDAASEEAWTLIDKWEKEHP